MKILISACLLGVPCRYDGASKPHPLAQALLEEHQLVPVCPEQLGGLPTPRPPAERRGNRVVSREGTDVTEAYRRGAEAALTLCRPSCGRGVVYDGTFTGALTEGDGVTAELLSAHGILVSGESGIPELLEALR